MCVMDNVGMEREDGACSIGFDLYSRQHQEGLGLHVHGGGTVNWHVRLPFSF